MTTHKSKIHKSACATSRRVLSSAPPPSLQILIGERCVLHTLGFQLTVEHPYSRVISLLKKVVALRRDSDGGEGGDKALSRQLYQVRCVRAYPTELLGSGVVRAVVYAGILFALREEF